MPSEAARPAGLAVRVAVPETGRYGAEAPIVIQVPGGWDGGRVQAVGAPLTALGFIELRFAFPGGGEGAQRSGGTLDARGPASTLALADVIAFAGGATRALDGRRIDQLAAPLRPLTRQVGLLGWDDGGNSAVLALAEHDRKIQPVAWVATWETPVGDGTQTGLLGDATSVNPLYAPETGAFDLSRLAWDPELRLQRPADLAPPGAFYFDLDGRPGRGPDDLVPAALAAPEPAGGVRYAYPVAVLREATARHLVAVWPRHLLTLEEATSFWRERNAAGQFLHAVINRPELLVEVLGAEPDHALAAPDHPHLYAAYQGWREAKVAWLRLNPDAAYLAATAGSDGVDDTIAGLPLERLALPRHLVPAGIRPAELGAAAAAELADRVRFDNRSPDLDAPLAPVVRIERFHRP